MSRSGQPRLLLACLALLMPCASAGSQEISRLPPVTASDPQPTAPSYSDQPYIMDHSPVEAPPSVVPPPREFRLIQKTNGTIAWLAAGDDDGLGLTEAEISFTTVIPPILIRSPLFITPRFTVTSLEQPTALELPSELYRAAVNIMWVKQATERLSFMAMIAPGVSSDNVATTDSFRMFGLGVANYQWTPTLQLTGGAVYTGREDFSVFPVAGLTWTPQEDLRVELTAPRPRVARRIHCLPKSNPEAEDWLYFAGELGGGTWAVRRHSGDDDLLTIRDFRLVLGYERKAKRGVRGLAEVAYVLGRKVEFENDRARIKPSDTIMLRTGITF